MARVSTIKPIGSSDWRISFIRTKRGNQENQGKCHNIVTHNLLVARQQVNVAQSCLSLSESVSRPSTTADNHEEYFYFCCSCPEHSGHNSKTAKAPYNNHLAKAQCNNHLTSENSIHNHLAIVRWN